MIVVHLLYEDTELFFVSPVSTDQIPESENEEDHENNTEKTHDGGHQHRDEVILDTAVLP